MFASSLFEEDWVEPPRGLVYEPGFMSEVEEREMADWIDEQAWDTAYSRRRQFYGYSYSKSTPMVEIPSLLGLYATRLLSVGLVLEVPRQVLINEYFPGQGIAAHVDEMPNLQSQVVTISLLDSYPMLFAHSESGQKYEHWLERRSIAVMSGESRTDWTHEIEKRKADIIQGGGRRMRGRRVSITYRTMFEKVG